MNIAEVISEIILIGIGIVISSGVWMFVIGMKEFKRNRRGDMGYRPISDDEDNQE